MNLPPLSEVNDVMRNAFALQGLPDDDVKKWFDRNLLDLDFHTRLGAVMALPRNAAVPKWAAFQRKPWPEVGLRLLAPLCDAQGALRSILASGVLPAMKQAAAPVGFGHAGLVVSCPAGRRMLMGLKNPKRLIVAAGFLDWIRLVQSTATQACPTAVWELLPRSWSQELVLRIPPGCKVDFVEALTPALQARLDRAKASLKMRPANSNSEIQASSFIKESA